MRWLFYSDSHFTEEAAAAPGIEPRLMFLEKTFDWISEQVLAYKPDYVFNLGDTNNLHGSISIVVLHAMCTAIGKVSDACSMNKARHVILAGNHDQGTADGASNLLPALRGGRFANTIIVEKYFLDASARFVCVAHSKKKDLIRSLTAAAAGGARYAMIHHPVTSILWRPGQPDDSGVELSTFEPFKFSFGGHYHHPQWKKNANFAIVGSSCYFNFNDTVMARPRGILRFDTEVGTPEWVENPHTPLYHTLVVKKSDEAVEWLTSGAVHKKNYKRLLLKVKCESEKAKRNVEKKLEAFPLARLIVRDMSAETETTHDREVLLDAPETAIRSFVKAAETELDRPRLVTTGLKAAGGNT